MKATWRWIDEYAVVNIIDSYLQDKMKYLETCAKISKIRFSVAEFIPEEEVKLFRSRPLKTKDVKLKFWSKAILDEYNASEQDIVGKLYYHELAKSSVPPSTLSAWKRVTISLLYNFL